MAKEIDRQLEDIKETLDEHTKILSSVDKTLALQAQQLELHIKRTEMAEENLELLREEFRPVEKHVYLINSLAKIITLLGTISGIVYVAWSIFHGKI